MIASEAILEGRAPSPVRSSAARQVLFSAARCYASQPKPMCSAKHIWVLLLLLAVAPSVGAQQNECATSIVVNARDKQGKFLPSLQANDFRARFEGKDAAILSLTKGTGARRVVIVLDKSGSMAGEAKRRAMQSIARELVHSVPENAQFALVVFAGHVSETIGFGHSSVEILAAIDRVSASPGEGQSALWDALLSSSELLGSGQKGDSVVVLSDGDESHSKSSRSTVEQAYLSKVVRIYFFEFIDHYFKSDENFSERDTVNLTLETGGIVQAVERFNAGELLADAQHVEDELSNYYLLGVNLPALQKLSSLRLEVVDPTGKHRKGIELSFPKKVGACAVRSASP